MTSSAGTTARRVRVLWVRAHWRNDFSTPCFEFAYCGSCQVTACCRSLYWSTGAIGSSFWPYYARMHGPWPIPEGGVNVPMGYAAFPREILRPPRSVAEGMYTDIRRWTVMPRGGHFAAMEQPEVLAREIVEFFRPLRPR